MTEGCALMPALTLVEGGLPPSPLHPSRPKKKFWELQDVQMGLVGGRVEAER